MAESSQSGASAIRKASYNGFFDALMTEHVDCFRQPLRVSHGIL
jgi:hypothetical protein